MAKLYTAKFTVIEYEIEERLGERVSFNYHQKRKIFKIVHKKQIF